MFSGERVAWVGSGQTMGGSEIWGGVSKNPFIHWRFACSEENLSNCGSTPSEKRQIQFLSDQEGKDSVS